jgi:hypothetical protein
MDKKTVFVKTKEGEEAVRQRTRLVQRNLRNILIMVDGQAPVADLAKRFGDENAAQAALAELQAGGFIVEVANQLDFTSPVPPGATEAKTEDIPLLTTQVTPLPSFDAAPESQSSPPPVVEEIILSAPEYESLPPPLQRAAPPRRAAEPVAAGPNWIDRIKSMLARKGMDSSPKAKRREPGEGDDLASGPAGLEPVERAPRLFISGPLLALFSVVGIVVLLALTVVLYPYSRHLPDIERNASARLQDPVKVGDIGFSFLPRPHIALHNIVVGKDAHLTIATVRAVPDFLSLMGEKKVFHELTFNRVAVRDAGLGKLARAAAGNSSVEIRHITINDLSLMVGDVLLGGIGGEGKLTAAGAVESLQLRNAEGTFKVDLQPRGEAYRLSAIGNAWKTPFKPKLTFQWLEVQGELLPSRLELSRIDGRAYEGLVEGKASLGWAGEAALAGDLELKRINADKMLAALESALSAEGDLSGRLKLSAKSNSLGKLSEALRVEGTFEMQRGTARGFDLGEAVRNAGRTPTRGGETKFEQMAGTFQCDPQNFRLVNLKLNSGLLKAGGNLGIADNGQLSGALDVELKSSAMTRRMHLTISGKSKDPLLTPMGAR